MFLNDQDWSFIAVVTAMLVLMQMTGCAMIRRPGIMNEGLKAENAVLIEQGKAITAWTNCCMVVTYSQEKIPDVCGPYPGHAITGAVNPWEKGVEVRIPTPLDLLTGGIN